jgi:hypothetical protein
MPISDSTLSVGCFVVLQELKHPRANVPVFGRVAHLFGNKVVVVISEDLGFGYAEEFNVSQVQFWDCKGDIPLGQMSSLGIPLSTILPEVFAR